MTPRCRTSVTGRANCREGDSFPAASRFTYARSLKYTLPFLFLLVTGALTPAQAQNDPADRVHIQFGREFRIPGATLPAGSYLFMPGDPVAGQLIIEIYKGDASELVATVLAIESELPRPGDATIVDYPGTNPTALRAWFHPGNPRGYEFVYTRDEGNQIFRQTQIPVPSTIADAADAELIGLLPIVHADDVYRVGVSEDLATAVGVKALPPTPVDRLTLARVAILSHMDSVPSDIATRLRLLDSQIRDVHTAYRMKSDDFPHKVSLAKASLGNMPAGMDQNPGTFEQTPALAHVLERVRAQIEAFEKLLQR